MSEQTSEAPVAPAARGVTDRAVVVEILASMGQRSADEVPEWIDSMALAWLVHQVEQRYGTRLELDGEQFLRMGTVDGAVDVLNEVIVAAPHG